MKLERYVSHYPSHRSFLTSAECDTFHSLRTVPIHLRYVTLSNTPPILIGTHPQASTATTKRSKFPSPVTCRVSQRLRHFLQHRGSRTHGVEVCCPPIILKCRIRMIDYGMFLQPGGPRHAQSPADVCCPPPPIYAELDIERRHFFQPGGPRYEPDTTWQQRAKVYRPPLAPLTLPTKLNATNPIATRRSLLSAQGAHEVDCAGAWVVQ